MFWVVLGLIGVALVFDYINGFHDAANSIATVVSTRVLSPGKAVIWAAFFNFIAQSGSGAQVGVVDCPFRTGEDRDPDRTSLALHRHLEQHSLEAAIGGDLFSPVHKENSGCATFSGS